MFENQTKFQFHFLSQDFLTDVKNIIEDFYEITSEKNKNIKKSNEELKKDLELVKDEFEDFSTKYSLFKKVRGESLKNHHFRFAIFNYLVSTFERHVNLLIEKSIIHKSEVRTIILQKFIEYDESKIRNGEKSIRSSKWELMNKEEKDLILIRHIKDIIRQTNLPPIQTYKLFFNVTDKKMFVNKNLWFDYVEIRSRRNLLTHRGTNFDNEYVESLLNSVTKSKNVENPEERINTFFQRGYFTFEKFKDKETYSLELLLKNEKKSLVKISDRYFFHTFVVLFRIYFTLFQHVKNDDDFIVNSSHDFLVLGRKTKIVFFPLMVIELTHIYQEKYKLDEDLDIRLKVNYLLAISEIKNNIENFESFSLNNNIEKFRSDVEKLSHEDNIFKVLLNVLDKDFPTALLSLSQCKDLTPEIHDWFMFVDLVKDNNFLTIFNKVCIKKVN